MRPRRHAREGRKGDVEEVKWETGPKHHNSGHGKPALLRPCTHNYHLLPHGCIQVFSFCAHPLSIARHDACGTAMMASNRNFRHTHAGAAAASQKSAACQLQLPLARRKHAARRQGEDGTSSMRAIMAGVANTFKSPLPMSAAVFWPWTHAVVASPRMPCREQFRKVLLCRSEGQEWVNERRGVKTKGNGHGFHRLDDCARRHPGPEASPSKAVLNNPAHHSRPGTAFFPPSWRFPRGRKKREKKKLFTTKSLQHSNLRTLLWTFKGESARPPVELRGTCDAPPSCERSKRPEGSARCSTTQRRALRAWRSCRLLRSRCRSAANAPDPLPLPPRTIVWWSEACESHDAVLLPLVVSEVCGRGVCGTRIAAPHAVARTGFPAQLRER